jgi:hypothetical protein
MVQRLKTIAEVLRELGGPAEVGRLTGKSTQAVWNWGDRGRIAPDAYLVMTAELERRGFSAPAELWTIQTPTESAPLARRR